MKSYTEPGYGKAVGMVGEGSQSPIYLVLLFGLLPSHSLPTHAQPLPWGTLSQERPENCGRGGWAVGTGKNVEQPTRSAQGPAKEAAFFPESK